MTNEPLLDEVGGPMLVTSALLELLDCVMMEPEVEKLLVVTVLAQVVRLSPV